MKRIMLIQPWKYHDEGIPYHNLSLEWRNGPYASLLLAAYLKKFDMPVQVIDLQPVLVKNAGLVEKCFDYLSNTLNEFKPDIIGISFFSYQYIEVQKIISFLNDTYKKINPDVIFVAGGIHASIEPKLTIERLGFDYAFVGEGELGLLDIACGKKPDDVPGIVSRYSANIEPAEIIKDLDSLPFLDWNLCDYKFYSSPSYGKIAGRAASTLDLMLGRGCIYKCTFCAYPALSKVRYYSAEYLINQIKEMRSLYGIDSVYFIDSSIGNKRALLKEFCELSIKSGISKDFFWYANMRANQVDESLLKLMWDAGCRALLYGFESGSQRVLDLMNKRCTIENNIRTAELHNKLKFPYHASIILGFPGEKEEDIYMTFNFLLKVHPPMIGINWYVPLPGSPDYDSLRRQGLVEVENPYEWRKIGEVLTTGKIYASIEERRFRQLYSEALALASMLKVNNIEKWMGS